MTSGQTDQHSDPENNLEEGGAAAQDKDENGSLQKSVAEREKDDLANLGKLMLDIADIIDDDENAAPAPPPASSSPSTQIQGWATPGATAQSVAEPQPDPQPQAQPVPQPQPVTPVTAQSDEPSQSVEPSQSQLTQQLSDVQEAANQSEVDTPDSAAISQEPPSPKPTASQTKLNPFFALSEAAAKRAEQQAAERQEKELLLKSQPTDVSAFEAATPPQVEQAAFEQSWQMPTTFETEVDQQPEANPEPSPVAQEPVTQAPPVVPAPVISAPPQWALDAAATPAQPDTPPHSPASTPPTSDAAPKPILSAVVSKRELSQSAQLQTPNDPPPPPREWSATVEATAPSESVQPLQPSVSSALEPFQTQPSAIPPQLEGMTEVDETAQVEALYDPQSVPYEPQPYEPQPYTPQQPYEPQPYDPQPYAPQQPYTPQQPSDPQAYEPLQSEAELPTEPAAETPPAAPEEPIDLRNLFSADAKPASSGLLPKSREMSHPTTSRSLIKRRTTESSSPAATPTDQSQSSQSQTHSPLESTSAAEAADLRNLFSDDVATPAVIPTPTIPSSQTVPSEQPTPIPPQSPQPEISQGEQIQAALRKTMETSSEFGALPDDEFKMSVTPEQLQAIAEQTKKPKARKTFLGLPAWGAQNSLTGEDPGAQNQTKEKTEKKARKTFFGLPAFGANESVTEQPKPAEQPGAKPRKTFLGIPAIPLVDNLFNREAPPVEPSRPQEAFDPIPEFEDTPIDPNRQTVFDRAAQTAAEYQEPGADDLAEWVKSAHYAFERGQFEDAERYYLRVLGIMETRTDLEESLVIECMKNLGDVYFFLGKTEDAVDVFEQLASTLEKTPDETYLNVVVDLARAYGTVGRLSQGAELCMRAMQLAGDILPPGHELHGRLNTAYVNIIRRKTGDARAIDLTGAPSKHRTQERGLGLRSKVAVRLEPLDDEVQTRSHELMKSKDFLAALNTVGITVLICGIVLGTTQRFLSTVAATEQAKASAEYTGREYKTVDGLKSLRFEKDNRCYYWREGKLLHAQYFAVGTSWMEAFRLLAGCQRVRDIWYQVRGDRIVDGDGSVLYLGTAPENAVAKRMWWYSGFASWHMTEHKSYPTDAEKWKDIAPDFYYTNPFNGKPDVPVFIQAKGAASPQTVAITATGAAWPRQPAVRPGLIVALCLDYVRFFIRGYDRDGQLLTSSKPGKVFYIELRDGQNITQDELMKYKDKAELSQDPTPVRVYMTQDAGVASVLSFMKMGIPGGLWLLWLLSLGQSFVVLRLCDTVAKRLLSFAGIIVPSILLFMWYVVAFGWV